jgi:hypothetical protein
MRLLLTLARSARPQFLSELFVFFSVAAAAVLCVAHACALACPLLMRLCMCSALVCLRRYGAQPDAFLAAVADTAGEGEGNAGRTGLSVLDAAREAASAVKVVESLNAIRELLRAQAADVAQAGASNGVDDARATFLSLAALLSVANGAASKKARERSAAVQPARHAAFAHAPRRCSCSAQFDASEWSLTEAESVRIARVFARHASACCFARLALLAR